MQSDLHHQLCTYLYDVLRAHPGAIVISDVRIAWDVPGLRPYGPDIAVIVGVRERQNWRAFDVAQEGVRPVLIIEVTSPESRWSPAPKRPKPAYANWKRSCGSYGASS